MDELVAVPAFDAERSFVDGMVPAGRDPGNDVVFDVKIEAAAAPAPGADGGNLVHTTVL
jgi:hypothetical protein